MLLSKLVYQSIKSVIYLNDMSFAYDSFLRGDSNADPDYDMQINNVFVPLNEALARLSDLERIPYKVDEVKVNYEDKTIDLNNLLLTDTDKQVANVKEMHAVGQFIGGKPVYLRFKQMGSKLVILDPIEIRFPVYIEYKEELPFFSRDDLVVTSLDEETGNVIDNNIDLKQYNINDSMCSYVIEYVQGKLMEQIEPALANLHVTRAETYFNNIRTVRPVFLQNKVVSIYRIGE